MDNNKLNKIMPLVILIGALTYIIVKNWEVASGIIIALLGFGMLVFVHELGHFLVARWKDVQCDAFAIGMAIGTPFLFGIKKEENSWRVRILPKTSGVKEDPEEDCLYMFHIPAKGRAGDTEYCLGPLPIGGFVKMVGQDDSGPVDAENDTNPRSFANKSVGARMAITAAGVIANIIAAFAIFIGLAAYGIERVPAVVGGVVSNSPAAQAGLQPGDEIVEINGKSRWVGGRSNLDFTHIALKPMLGKRDVPINLVIKTSDGSRRELDIIPAKMPDGNYGFGIEKPRVLRLADIQDPDGYYQEIGLLPGDEVFAVNGEPVSDYPHFSYMVERAFVPKVTISAKRPSEDQDYQEAVTTDLETFFSPAKTAAGEIKLANAASIVPLLKIAGGDNLVDDQADQEQFLSAFAQGDVILTVGDFEYPNFLQFREAASAYVDKDMPVTVLRGGEKLNITVVPRMQGRNGRAVVGVQLNLAMEKAIAASFEESPLPAGAKIESVNAQPVESFYRLAQVLHQAQGQSIDIEYSVNSETLSKSMNIAQDAVSIRAVLENPIPFDDYRRLFKAENPLQALHMGTFLIVDMVDQAISSIRALILNRVSAEEMSGPVGIARISYVIVQHHDFAFFLYFLGMISCFLAVFNFLPIPVVDGGLFVLLIIEKIKGSPVSVTVQKYLVYIGISFLVALLLFVTFNDILKIARGLL